MEKGQTPPGSDNAKTPKVENVESRAMVTEEQIKRAGELFSEVLRKGGAIDGIDSKSFEPLLRMDDAV